MNILFLGGIHSDPDCRLEEILEQVQETTLSPLEYSNLKESIDGLVSQLDTTNSQ